MPTKKTQALLLGQASLWGEPEPITNLVDPGHADQVLTNDPGEAQPEPGQHEAEQQTPEMPTFSLEELAVYSRATMLYLKEHDLARRAALRTWAREHGWKERWFVIHGQRSGYVKHGIPEGEEAWERFLQGGVQYDMYCLFISVFFHQFHLSHFLEDAVVRGEIKPLVQSWDGRL